MFLAHALLKSSQGIATMTRQVPNLKKGVQEDEIHIAFITHKKDIFIVHSRVGSIRKADAVDHGRNDWVPFAYERQKYGKVKLSQKDMRWLSNLGIPQPSKVKDEPTSD